ncbi:S8 family serine peptidase [Allokutzneria sp. NRRL B-24872]|uniref:S8 family serine peptidase n=1 Tax=Allokutzneria sp. NRRL B-24872 TaxID=1137961 RepID=UPI000A3A815F|nr:S8 family serine peptidase [Allokutzneria sp. NRRL B-24872]
MRRSRRALLVAATATSVLLSVGVVNASGQTTGEQVRLTGDGSFSVSFDGGKNWSRQLPTAKKIHLVNRSFDPKSADAQRNAPAGELRAEETGVYLVQFTAAPLDSQRKELRGLGARVGAFIPDYAYVVRMDKATSERVAKLDHVRWVGAYQAGDKLSPGLAEAVRAKQRLPQHRYLLTLVEADAADQSALVAEIGKLGGKVESASASRQHVEATLTHDQLLSVAKRAEVLAAEKNTGEVGTDMDLARQDVGATTIETAGGYKGEGVRGEVMDSGLRVTHQEFQKNAPVMHGGNGSSPSHGTSTYGEIFASGVSAKQRGLLSEGQGIFAAYQQPDRYKHTQELVDPAGKYRAVFQTNSWGSPLTTAYTAISSAFDKTIFDTDLFICNSQSNAGSQQSRPEAWAKNVLSVGAQYHKNTLDRADDQWNRGASIGPAADGRIKPDVSHYYDNIDTTSSNGDATYTTSFGGTSGATPITCGTAGLAFQMWADGVFDGGPGKKRDVFDSRPHAATMKALLINTANQYAFSGETHDLTRVHQGWGTASVGNMYELAKANGWKLPVLVNESEVLKVGQTSTHEVTTDGSKPLKATLAYSDPEAAPSAAKTLVNDLTLKVTAPDGTVYWGNNGLRAGNFSTPGGSADTIDNVENVIIEKPAAGTWKIEVSADAINVDAHRETPDTDADFALVVTK